MCVSDDVFAVVLKQRNAHVEQLFPPGVLVVLVFLARVHGVLHAAAGLAHLQHPFDIIFLRKNVSMHCVHGDLVVVQPLLRKLFTIELQVVTFEDLILVEREGVFDRHILNVLICILSFRLGLGHIVRLANELVQDWDVFEFLYFNFEDVF